MAHTFKIGDVVRLKSGGPKMVVHSLESSGMVWCQWFVDNKPAADSFKPETLELAD
jgi:uncharacterized protein YodC (DUF2158 family)